jgi:hypothetical protein
MLADASISRADVSKAKPLAPQPAIGHTHAGRRPQRGRQAVASTVAARHTNCRRPLPRRRAGARSPPRRGGPVRARSPPRRGGVVAGDGGACVSGRSGAVRRRRGALRGWVRRGEAAARTGASRKNDAIWGETVKCSGRLI